MAVNERAALVGGFAHERLDAIRTTPVEVEHELRWFPQSAEMMDVSPRHKGVETAQLVATLPGSGAYGPRLGYLSVSWVDEVLGQLIVARQWDGTTLM